MPVFLKFVLYCVVFFVLLVATNYIPKSYEPFKGMAAIMVVVWMIGGVFVLVRAAFRFVTR